MHHTIAKNAEDLLNTESCVCGTDYCNNEKPEITVPEKMECRTFVQAEVMGTKVRSILPSKRTRLDGIEKCPMYGRILLQGENQKQNRTHDRV